VPNHFARPATPSRWLFATATAAALLMLSACTPPTRPDKAPITAPEIDIEQLLSSEDYQSAADQLLAQAKQSTSPQAEQLRLAAATALLNGRQWDAAEQILNQLPLTGPVDYQTAFSIQQARLLIGRNQAQTALLRLGALGENVTPTLQPDYHRTRAEAYAAVGNHLESARERVWLDGLLSKDAQADNHQAIWNSLSQIPAAILHNLRTMPPPDVLSGWMELVETARAQRDNPQQLGIALSIWQERYPGHPAQPDFVARLQHQVSSTGPATHAQHIGVLLPLSGPLAEAGTALRDGILAGYYQSTAATTTQLRFYDTGGDTGGRPDQIQTLYQQAVTEGAQQIIGPLTKESVAALAGMGNFQIPVLALNTLGNETSSPAQFYQFSLSPEDEASQVAERAWLDGQRRALALVPEGAWGERLLQAFTQQWQILGGTLLEVQRYGSDQRSYSNDVRNLLNIDASEKRHQAISRLIGQQPEFEPRRRQDADFVFMVASASQARLLRPLLRFHHASHLPAYTTSHIYEDTADHILDTDLDGLRFCDMPWVLPVEQPDARRADIRRLWPDREQRYTRLYAMGIDAFLLTPYLKNEQANMLNRLDGVTGTLYMDNARQVHRRLQWSEIKQGRIVSLPAHSAPEPVQEGTGNLDTTSSQDLTDDYPATAPDSGGQR